MNQDSRLYKWLLKQQKKNDIKEGMGTGFKHRAAYHREFSGYSEIRHPKENGRFRIERVYIAPWYQHDVSYKGWIALKIFYAITVIVSAALFIIASLQQTSWNYSKITGAFQCVTAIILVVFAARVIILAAVPRNMTNGQCNSIDRPLTRWSFLAFLAYTAFIIWDAAYLIFFPLSGDFRSESVTLWMLIPGMLLLAAAWIIQRNVKFNIIENQNVIGEDQESYDIL